MKLKQLRRMVGLNQVSFAKLFGLSQNTLSNYESGNRAISSEMLKSIANKFGCTVDYLLDNDQICDDRISTALVTERKHYGVSLDELSKHTKIPLQDLKSYEEGLEPINRYLLELICKYYGISLYKFYLDTGLYDEYIPEIFNGDVDKYEAFKNARDLDAAKENTDKVRPAGVRIPILGRVIAGIPIDAIQNIEGYIDIPESWAAKGEHFGLRVKGHSMEPRIMEGDLAIIRKQEDVENGKIALVQINGNTEATIKKIRYQDNGIILIALNEAVYAPHFYSKEDIKKLPVIVVGQVVHVWHDLE